MDSTPFLIETLLRLKLVLFTTMLGFIYKIAKLKKRKEKAESVQVYIDHAHIARTFCQESYR